MIRPEDEKKISKITHALRLSREAGCILLVAFNDELLRRDVEAEIKRRLEPEGFDFRELRVTEDIYRNIPIMLVNMNPQPEDIFLIYDLRKAIPKEYYDTDGSKMIRPEVLDYLNYRREDFVEHNISAIFWLDEPTLTLIARKALDFYAFRSLPVFEFKTNSSQEMVIPGRTTLSETFSYSSLEELDEKIALREEMLDDYLEKRPEDYSTIGNLHSDLGNLYYSKSQSSEAIAHYEEALKASRKIKHRQGEAATLGNIGNVCRTQGDLDKALDYHSQALELNRRLGYVQGEADDLNNMGNVYRTQGELGKALEFYSQALELHRRIGYVQGEASDLGNIGNIYRDQEQLDKALELYSQALELNRRLGYVQGEAVQLGNMGVVYCIMGNMDKALESYSQALELNRRIGYIQGEASDLGNMGNVYYTQGNLAKALEYHSQALELDRSIGDIQGEASDLGNMGNVYYTQGSLDKALDYTKQALGILVSIGMPLYADIVYENLQNIKERMKAAEIEISEEDKKEIAELTKAYEKLKGEAVGTAAS